MKVLVTGVTGQLGHDCVAEFAKRGVKVKGVSSKDFSLTDYAKAREVITAYSPDVVVHCAAWTAVDRAEDEKDACEAVNAGGTRNIAEICRDLDAKLIVYNDHPIDKWCLFNTAVDIDRNDNIQPAKTSIPTRRIDGTAALLDAYVIYQTYLNDYLTMI